MNWELFGWVFGVVFLAAGFLVAAIGVTRFRRHRRHPLYRDEAIYSLTWMVPGAILMTLGAVCLWSVTT